MIPCHLPLTNHDQDNGTCLHITVLNSAYFEAVTGRAPPSSPISARTYLELQLLWYTLFEEKIPGVTPPPEFHIQSIAEIDISRKTDEQNEETQQDCDYCKYEMATMWLSPCNHVVCDDCAAGLSENSCPSSSCDKIVERREWLAAPMPLPGNEGEVAIDPDVIVTLKRHCGATKEKVITFMRGADKVSPLRGAAQRSF